ncbi:MAG: hypothetical protein H6565_00235 [Lewinellaceae bacterium]|nr:hypothetical protein [Lewinellaceae bacterium]
MEQKKQKTTTFLLKSIPDFGAVTAKVNLFPPLLTFFNLPSRVINLCASAGPVLLPVNGYKPGNDLKIRL